MYEYRLVDLDPDLISIYVSCTVWSVTDSTVDTNALSHAVSGGESWEKSENSSSEVLHCQLENDRLFEQVDTSFVVHATTFIYPPFMQHKMTGY